MIYIKNFTTYFFAIFFLIGCTQNPNNNNKDYYVIILAGQSNMVGHGDLSTLTDEQRSKKHNIIYYNYGVGSNQKTKHDKFGPEIILSNQLSKKYRNKNFILFKYAVGGSSLLDWSPTYSLRKAAITQKTHYGALYEKLLKKYKEKIYGENMHLLAFLWLQGERDARFIAAAEEYNENFSEFIQQLRVDLNSPDLPIIFGRVNPPITKYPGIHLVRNAQENISKNENVEMLNLDMLTKEKDNVHYDTEGIKDIGEMFVNKLNKYINAQQTHTL